MPVTTDPTYLGYCPTCNRGMPTVLPNGRGHCERHGWVWANWNGPPEPEWECWQCEDGEALRAGQACLTCGIERLEEK